jgi:hypothetical protein
MSKISESISLHLLHSIPKKLYSIILSRQEAFDDEFDMVLSTKENTWQINQDSGWIVFAVAVPPYGASEPIQICLEWKGELALNEHSGNYEFTIAEIKSSCPLLYDAVNNLQVFIDCETAIYSMFADPDD